MSMEHTGKSKVQENLTDEVVNSNSRKALTGGPT